MFGISFLCRTACSLGYLLADPPTLRRWQFPWHPIPRELSVPYPPLRFCRGGGLLQPALPLAHPNRSGSPTHSFENSFWYRKPFGGGSTQYLYKFLLSDTQLTPVPTPIISITFEGFLGYSAAFIHNYFKHSAKKNSEPRLFRGSPCVGATDRVTHPPHKKWFSWGLSGMKSSFACKP